MVISHETVGKILEILDWVEAVGDCNGSDTEDFICNSWESIEDSLTFVRVILTN